MGTTETEPIRIEGVVRAGERVEVELRVGGQRVARGSRGERLEVEAAGGPVSLDVSALVLDAVPTSSHRGAWSELAARPEAALVADRSPAPHVAAELRIRRIAPGMAIAVEAIPTEHAFAESTVMRSPASRRPSAARATRMASPERPDGGGRVRFWLALPTAFAALATFGCAGVALASGSVRASLVSVAVSLSVAVAARFVHRALIGTPAMDHGMASPFPRLFARAARSLPRFDPEASDASRWIGTILGPMVVLGAGYAVFLGVVWPVATLRGDIRVEALSPVGASAMMGGLALALVLLTIGYASADASELPRVRSLLGALGTGAWRACSGVVVSSGEEEVLFRSIAVDADTGGEDVRYSARHRAGGEPTFAIRTADGVVPIAASTLSWASDDFIESGRGARQRVRNGATVLVAGFVDADGALVGRGPASMMLFASASGPELALRVGLRRRLLDVVLASAAAALVAAAAAGIYLF